MTPLDCNELVELVTAYLDGALAPEDEGRVIEHLSTCDGCSTYVDQIRFTIRQLSHADPGPLDEGRRRELLAAFRDIPTDPV